MESGAARTGAKAGAATTVAAGLRLAVGTLTIVPSGPVTITPRTAGAAMLLAPLAVLPVALAAGLVAAVAPAIGVPTLVTAILVLGVLAYGTRAMHLDGLADTVDGLGGGWTRDRALEIMRAGDIGPMGAATLALTLGLQAAALVTIIDATSWLAQGVLVTLTVMASRLACALTCRRGVPAAEGSSLGAGVAGSVPVAAAGLAVVLGAAALAATTGATIGPGWTSWSSVGVVVGAAAVVLAAGAVLLLLRQVVPHLGGITGDVLGAAVEVAFTVTLVVLATGLGREVLG